MSNTIVTVGSVTYAIKLQKHLLRAGIRSKLVKVGDSMSRGCTHGLEIDNNDFYSAVKIMRESGIEYHVYKEQT